MAALPNGSLLGLDIGAVRIGVAIVSMAARLPRPLTTLSNDDQLLAALQSIISTEAISGLVIGYPRGLDGQITAQTESVKAFSDRLHKLGLPLYFQDESLTSVQAEAELRGRGNIYQKADIDALAATIILEDYLKDNGA